jgi:hypothetical protein
MLHKGLEGFGYQRSMLGMRLFFLIFHILLPPITINLTNRLNFPVVCSVIDIQYDVICGKNKKVSTSRLGERSLFVLTTYDVILCIYI